MANQGTIDAGLTLNVIFLKRKMRDYYDDYYGVDTEKGEGEDAKKKTYYTFSNGHVAVTALLEDCITYILTETLKFTNKDTETDLKTIGAYTLSSCVRELEGFQEFFSYNIDKVFSGKKTYDGNLPVSKKEYNQVIKNIDPDIKFTFKGRNLLDFMINEIYINLLYNLRVITEFAKKKTINSNTVVAAVELMFGDTTTTERFIAAIDRAVENAPEEEEDEGDSEAVKKPAAKKKAGGKKKTAVDEAEDDADNEDDEEKHTKNNTKKTKAAANPKKKAVKIEEEDGGDEVVDDEDPDLEESAPTKKTSPKLKASKN